MRITLFFLLLIASLAAKETERLIIRREPPLFTLALQKNPFKPNDRLTLYQQTIENRVAPLFVLRVNEKGVPMAEISDGRSLPLVEICLSDEYFLPAEPVEYILIADDQLHAAHARFIPKPIETCLPTGQKIWLELETRDNRTFKLYGTGFLPREQLTLTTYSNNEKSTDYILTNQKGTFICYVKPALLNTSSGTAKTLITTANLETLTLAYTWGQN